MKILSPLEIKVLSEHWMGPCECFEFHNRIPEGIKYMQELTEEIKRVSSPFAIIVGGVVRDYFGEANLINYPSSAVSGGVYSFDK